MKTNIPKATPPKEGQQGPNKDYVLQSLMNQLAEANMRIANCEAMITEQHQKLDAYKEKDDNGRYIREVTAEK